MRFSIFYSLSDKFLPIDYRRGFLSLMKKAIEESTKPALKRVFYSEHKLKPFTFSVYFPRLGKENQNGTLPVGDKAVLNFSTSSKELAAHLYNGFLKVKEFPIFQNCLKFEKIQMRQNVIINSDTVIFKTISPILISNIGSSEWYILPGEEGFLEGLKFSVEEMAKEFLGITEFVFEFKPKFIKRKILRHYNMHMSSFTGVFEIKSDPIILQMIYDAGLGVRRGQGFGMLDVVGIK